MNINKLQKLISICVLTFLTSLSFAKCGESGQPNNNCCCSNADCASLNCTGISNGMWCDGDTPSGSCAYAK